MHERYSNRDIYFNEQAQTTRRFVIPYINEVKEINENSRVLEIGCGEGGNLLPFVEMGCECVGVDLDPTRIDLANDAFSKVSSRITPRFIYKNIYDTDVDEIGQYDIIMLRDVIEHIPDQDRFMGYMKRFLKKDGVVFFGFPPWQMPYGGHQQIASVSWIRKAPFLHLLPTNIYKTILKKSGMTDDWVQEFMDIKNTGISIDRFEKIVKKNGYIFKKETPYFINPNYEVKFKLKTRGKVPILGSIPYVRNFVTTCLYAVVALK